MAVVNKFNVNKEQVTLDADIIENMSANDVSYDASTQYNENTVGNKLSELESEVIYDVTANNDGTTFDSLSVLLSSENLSTLIPTSVRHGGMSIRFIQSSDNKYIQARCMNQNFTTDVTQWQGVDDEPTAESQNLVDSDGIVKNLYNSIGNVFVITSFWGNRITNYNNGQIGKSSIVDGVKIDGICVPVVGGNVYMFSDIQLWSHSNAVNKVWFYSQYPTTENCLDCKINIVVGVDGKFTAPSSAKYMVLSCEVDNCGNNKRIIVYVDGQSQHEVHIKDWILGECYTFSSAVRDSNGLVNSANIVYPDGMTGTLSITRNSDDAATSAVYTYGTDIYTLDITRNSNGDVTSTSIIKN